MTLWQPALTLMLSLSGQFETIVVATEKDPVKFLVQKVTEKLLKAAKALPNAKPFLKPIKVAVVADLQGEKYNAGAYGVVPGDKFLKVEITRGYVVALGRDEHALAFVLGHEFGHHACGHTQRDWMAEPTVVTVFRNRNRETEADEFGIRVAMRAGYSLKRAARVSYEAMELIGGIYSPNDGKKHTHPAWSARLAQISKLRDSEEARLWTSMGAFENGVSFLKIEDYPTAEWFFARVVDEFPNCHEAWLNLGVARLTRYSQSLSADEMRHLGVGYLLGLTHATSAKSLIVRGDAQTELWKLAELALLRAIKLQPASAMAHVNLALAYQVRPETLTDEIDPQEKFAAALKALKTDKTLEPQDLIAMLMHLGIARVMDGKTDDGVKLFGKAQKLRDSLSEGSRQSVDYEAKSNRVLAALQAAATGKKVDAVKLFEQILADADPRGPWFPVAYDKYEELSVAEGLKVKPRTEWEKANRFAILTQQAVQLKAGGSIALGNDLADALARLGTPTRTMKEPLVGIRRIRFDDHGIELLANDLEIIAIVVVGIDGPTIPVKVRGGGRTLGELRIGMTRAQVEDLPGGDRYVQRPVTGFDRLVPYYRHLGVAVRYDGSGESAKVIELTVVQIPDGDIATPKK